MKTFTWWRHRVLELVAAFGMAGFIIVISQSVSQRQQELVAPDAWLQVNEVFVPDHKIGANPVMIYDRVIREEFDGFWIVEVQRQTKAGLWATACSGSGVNTYAPGEVIENNTVTWEWFIGETCAVGPGSFRLRVTYTMTRPGWPAKRQFILSNVFYVSQT